MRTGPSTHQPKTRQPKQLPGRRSWRASALLVSLAALTAVLTVASGLAAGGTAAATPRSPAPAPPGVTASASGAPARYGGLGFERRNAAASGVTLTPVGAHRYRVDLPPGAALRQVGRLVAVVQGSGSTFRGYLGPEGGPPAPMTRLGPHAVEITGPSPRAYAWRTGWVFFLPVVYFNRGETHRMGRNVAVVSALAFLLPMPLSAVVRVAAAVIAKAAADAEDVGACIRVHATGIPTRYRGGYCH